jgi:hypothetical protein
MKLIAAIILALSLQGCASWFTKHEEIDFPVISIAPDVVTIDSKLLELCAKLPEEVDLNSFESLLVQQGDLLTMYVNCANKQAASIKLLKKFGNIK